VAEAAPRVSRSIMKRRSVAAGALCVLSALAVFVVLLSTTEVDESVLAERRINVQKALGHVAYSHGVFSAESEDEDRSAGELFAKARHGHSTVDDVMASVEKDLATVSHNKHVAPAERINTGEHIGTHSVRMSHADDHPNPFLSASHELGGLIATKRPAIHNVQRKVRKVHRRSTIDWKRLQRKLHKELHQKSNALVAGIQHKPKAKHSANKLEKDKQKGDHKVNEAIHRMNSELNSRIKAATHVRSKKHTQKLHQLIADAKHGMQQRLKQEKRKRQELGTKEKQVKAHRADDISKARVKGDARLAKAQKQITKQEVKAEDRYFERKLHSQFSKIVREAFAKKDLPPKKAVAPLSAAKVGPFKEAAQRRVAKRAKHLRSKVLKLSAKLAKLRQESTLRKAKLRLKASKARAQQRLLRLKDAREDELEIARFPKHVRKKLRSMHAALMHSKTKAFQRKKLAQLKQEEKHAFANVLRNQRSVSRMTTRLAAAKAHLAKLSKHKHVHAKQPSGILMTTSLENIEGPGISKEEEIGGLEDEVLNMEKQMRLQTLTILKQQQLLAAKDIRAGMRENSRQNSAE